MKAKRRNEQTEYFTLQCNMQLWKMQWQEQLKVSFDSCLTVPFEGELNTDDPEKHVPK